MKKIFLILGIVSACLSASAQTVNIYEIQNGTKLLINSLRNTDAKKYAVEFKKSTDTIPSFDPTLVNSFAAPDSIYNEALLDTTLTKLFNAFNEAEISKAAKFFTYISDSTSNIGNPFQTRSLVGNVHYDYAIDSTVVSRSDSAVYIYRSSCDSVYLTTDSHYAQTNIGGKDTLVQVTGKFPEHQVVFTDKDNKTYTVIMKAVGANQRFLLDEEKEESLKVKDSTIVFENDSVKLPVFKRDQYAYYVIAPEQYEIVCKLDADTVIDLTFDIEINMADRVWNFLTDTYILKGHGKLGNVDLEGELIVGTNSPSAGLRLSVAGEQLVSATFDLGATIDIQGGASLYSQAYEQIYGITSVKATFNLLDWMKFVIYSPNVINLYTTYESFHGADPRIVNRINRLFKGYLYYPGSEEVQGSLEVVAVEDEVGFGETDYNLNVQLNFASDGTSVYVTDMIRHEWVGHVFAAFEEAYQTIMSQLSPRVLE